MRGRVLAIALGLAPGIARAQGRVAVDARTGDCPGAGEVTAALEARLPGVTARPREAGAGRRLELAPAEGAIALSLRDAAGAVELERQLSIDRRPAARPEEPCQALAEAAALIVVRYLQEIGYRPPAPVPEVAAPAVAQIAIAPPAPRRSAGLLGAAAGTRVGFDGRPARAEALLELGVLRGPLAVTIAGGASLETTVDLGETTAAELRMRSFPVRLGVGVPFVVGPGAVIPAVGLGLDVLSFRATGLVDARHGVRVQPAAELGASYLLPGRWLFARLSLVGGWALAPRDFAVGGAEPAFRTPRAYLRTNVELGAVLWKNPGGHAL